MSAVTLLYKLRFYINSGYFNILDRPISAHLAFVADKTISCT